VQQRLHAEQESQHIHAPHGELVFEQVCAKYYREVEGEWTSLATGADKRAAQLERVRRKMVTEMILEPLTDLRSEDYALDST
jgi:hypothetical protein